MYSYDKEFRMHISKHPERKWSVILQQAWSMKLKDRISKFPYQGSFGSPLNGNHSAVSGSESSQKSNDACRHYNRGNCKFGSNCHYDHKCSYCFKFGHSILMCYKLAADHERKQNSRKDGSYGSNSNNFTGGHNANKSNSNSKESC